MSHDIQIDAVRLALTLQQTRARVASINIANAGKPNATALRADFSVAEAALRQAAHAGSIGDGAHWLASAERALRDIEMTPTASPIALDEQVAEMATAGADYQALTEALNRRFGLMRLAISGRN